MLSFMKQESTVVDLLRKDHETIKTLFREFESASDDKTRHGIVKDAIKELELHAAAEESVFYPAVLDDAPDAASKIDESLEEHHVAKVLIGELKEMRPSDERYAAKFLVLAENVKHHIKEEEAELFARARTGHLDLNALAKRLEQAKMGLNGSPTTKTGRPRRGTKSTRTTGARRARQSKSHQPEKR
jgi:hemerythrin superfamily protein